MSSSPEKISAAQKKRNREKVRYTLNSAVLRKKSQLQKGTRRYKEASARLEAEISFFDEVIAFMEDRVADLGTRISVLTVEQGQLEACSEYLNKVFGEAAEDSPAKILLREVASDLQTVTRDLQKAEARQSYYMTRGYVAKNSKEGAETALNEERNKHTELTRRLSLAPDAVGEKTRRDGADSPLPPSSEAIEEPRYTEADLALLAPVEIVDAELAHKLSLALPPGFDTVEERRYTAGNLAPVSSDDLEDGDDDLEEQLDSDGQPPIPQASWDGW